MDSTTVMKGIFPNPPCIHSNYRLLGRIPYGKLARNMNLYYNALWQWSWASTSKHWTTKWYKREHLGREYLTKCCLTTEPTQVMMIIQWMMFLLVNCSRWWWQYCSWDNPQCYPDRHMMSHAMAMPCWMHVIGHLVPPWPLPILRCKNKHMAWGCHVRNVLSWVPSYLPVHCIFSFLLCSSVSISSLLSLLNLLVDFTDTSKMAVHLQELHLILSYFSGNPIAWKVKKV